QFLTAGSDETMKLWDLKTLRVLHVMPLGATTSPRSAFSPDGRLFAAAVREAPLNAPFKIWDTTTGVEVQVLPGHTNSPFGVAVSPDNRLLAASSFDRTIRVWDIAGGKELYTLPKPPDAAARADDMPGEIVGYSLAFSPDGVLLASAGAGNSVRLTDTKTGQ